MVNQVESRVESLGPANTIINLVTQHVDHAQHNRPGFVTRDPRSPVGVLWVQATTDKKGTTPRQVYTVVKTLGKQVKTPVGVLGDDGKTVTSGGRVVGEYRSPGLFPEVVVFIYRKIAEVFRMDAEFAARWASWQSTQQSKDMKALMAAFMLVQNHAGLGVKDAEGNVMFYDDDFRDIGEAMFLGNKDFNPKMVLRVGEILALPEVAAINREMGFSHSMRNPALGRYVKAVHRWLLFREQNPRMLQGLVKQGMKHGVRELARKTGYKPQSDSFFQMLGWKQKQASDGRRTMALDLQVQSDSWKDLSEREICQIITREKPGFKVVVGKLPENIGLTRAIMMACVQTGMFSNKDMLMYVPTFEELGLLTFPEVKSRLEVAVREADDARAANIARNVRTEGAKALLEAAAEGAVARAVEKATRNMRVYFLVDKSGSMSGALEGARNLISTFIGAFPLERIHVAVFDTNGREVLIKSPKREAVDHAFSMYAPSGGTLHTQGLKALVKYVPAADEDAIIIVVGDEGESSYGSDGTSEFISVAKTLRPVSFGVMEVNTNGVQGTFIKSVATAMGVPCFKVNLEMFKDPYAVVSNLSNLIASTPVGKSVTPAQPHRISLVEQILKTPLLQKPAWAH